MPGADKNMIDAFYNVLFLFNMLVNFSLEPLFLLFFCRLLGIGYLNPYSITVFALLPVRLLWLFAGPSVHFDAGIFDGTYQYLILLENLQFALRSGVAGLLLLFLVRNDVLGGFVDRFHYHPMAPERLRLCALWFFGLFVLFFVVTASWSFGLLNWIMSPRTGYQLHRTGAGAFYAMAVSLLAVSYVLALLAADSRRGIITTWMLFLPVVFLLGSKGYLVLYTITAFAFMLIHGFRLKLGMVLPIGLVMTAAVLLNFGSADLLDIFFYFDYYSNSAYFIAAYQNGLTDLFYGQIASTEIIGAIPRALWPDKPFVYGSTLLNEMFYPGFAEKGHTPAFGGPILAYADYGVPGVILNGLTDWSYLGSVLLAFLLLKRLRERGADFIRTHHFYIFLTLQMLAPGYLNFFQFPLNLGIMGFVALSIYACNTLPPLRLVRFSRA